MPVVVGRLVLVTNAASIVNQQQLATVKWL